MLRDLEVRGRVCSDCHAITDPRLISAGHPRGRGFDYVAAMQKIRHWEGQPAAPEALRTAFGKVLGARGVPLTRSSPADVRPQTSARAVANPLPPPASIPRPIAPEATHRSSVALTPFPEIDDSISVEEILVLLKERLEQLHRAVYGTR